MSMLYLIHLGSSLLLKHGTDHACSSVLRQLGSFCPIGKDPCTHLFQSLSVLQLRISLRMLSTKQIQHPPAYLVPASPPGHSPEAVLQAAVRGTAKVPIKWGEF